MKSGGLTVPSRVRAHPPGNIWRRAASLNRLRWRGADRVIVPGRAPDAQRAVRTLSWMFARRRMLSRPCSSANWPTNLAPVCVRKASRLFVAVRRITRPSANRHQVCTGRARETQGSGTGFRSCAPGTRRAVEIRPSLCHNGVPPLRRRLAPPLRRPSSCTPRRGGNEESYDPHRVAET